MQLNNGAKLVIPLVRALTTSSNAAAGSSVAVAPKPSAGGLVSLLGFGNSRISVPLSDPLPGVPVPLRSSIPTAAPKLETSALASGVRIASLKSVSPVATVALVMGGGSSAETEATTGASQVLASMAFKATKERTTFRMTRELEKIGVAYTSSTRDSITFAIDTVSLHVPEATEILLDSVLNARLQYHEVRDQLEIVKAVAKSLATPSLVLEDVLHRVAFDGPLGQTIALDEAVFADFSHETLRAYHASLLQPSNLLLASYGPELSELKALAQPLFGAAHLSSGAPVAASSYVGGTTSVLADSPLTYAALAFEAKGGVGNAKTAALAAVAKALLDESRGVLPWSSKSEGLSAVSSFSHLYKSSGLIGVSATSAPQQSGQLVDALFKKVEAAATAVSEAQLKVAKQVALSAYRTSLASGSTALPLIASELLAKGKFDSAEFASLVEAITPAQASTFIKDLAKSTPTLVTYGGLTRLPRLDSVIKRLA